MSRDCTKRKKKNYFCLYTLSPLSLIHVCKRIRSTAIGRGDCDTPSRVTSKMSWHTPYIGHVYTLGFRAGDGLSDQIRDGKQIISHSKKQKKEKKRRENKRRQRLEKMWLDFNMVDVFFSISEVNVGGDWVDTVRSSPSSSNNKKKNRYM